MDEEQLYKVIGRNIQYYRNHFNLKKKKEEKLTQEKLAELVGVSVSLIGNMESEKITQGISLYNLWKISRALNVSIEKFFVEIE